MTTPKLYLVRGLPGSGKSTYCRLHQSALSNHYEADMFFIDDEGKYNFDQELLRAAHQWCQDQAYWSLKAGFDTFVSNTFTTAKELKPYVEMAKELNVPFFIMTMHGNYQNIHNVPTEVLDRMKQRFQMDISSIL